MAEKSNEVNNGNETADIKLLFTILKELIRIPSPSGRERELADYILKEYTHGIYRYEGDKDALSNIFLFPKNMRGDEKLPILNAHLDIYNKDSVLTAEQLDHLRDADILTLDPKTLTITKKYPQVVGFDDKIGIAIILWLMKYTDLKFKVILSSQEEETKRSDLKIKYNNGNNNRQGGGGIQYALTSSKPLAFIKNSPSFIKDSRFGLVLDRQGRSDIIIKYGGVDLCSETFLSALENISRTVKFPMRKAQGRMGDAYNIRDHAGLNVVNLSCGIYCEHMTGEYLNIEEAFGTLKVVKYCLENPDLLDENER
jgi:tripeptide aminopeptidase